MKRDKEEDGFVHVGWEETTEGGTVGGARLTIETGSLSTIGITPDRDDQTPCFTVPAMAVEELLSVVGLPAR